MRLISAFKEALAMESFAMCAAVNLAMSASQAAYNGLGNQ
jgi:hypothetical protein